MKWQAASEYVIGWLNDLCLRLLAISKSWHADYGLNTRVKYTQVTAKVELVTSSVYTVSTSQLCRRPTDLSRIRALCRQVPAER